MKKTRGKLILLEGISGCGKTTLARAFVAPYLESLGIEVCLNSEPTRTKIFGRVIRKVIEGEEISFHDMRELRLNVAMMDVNLGIAKFVEQADPNAQGFLKDLDVIVEKIAKRKDLTERERQLMFLADRVLDVHQTIVPALNQGKWVVQDRFDLSSFAYGAAHGVPFEKMYELHRIVLGKSYIWPDATLFISVPPKVAMMRLQGSGKPIDIHENLKSLMKIDEKYTRVIAFMNEQRVEENMKDPSLPVAFVSVIQGDGIASHIFNEMKPILNALM